jgi:hypothetical protein
VTVPEPLWADPVAMAPSEQRGSGSLQPGHGYVQDEWLLVMFSYVDRCWYRCCDLQLRCRAHRLIRIQVSPTSSSLAKMGTVALATAAQVASVRARLSASRSNLHHPLFRRRSAGRRGYSVDAMSRANLALERDARKCSRVRNLKVYMLKAF